MRTYLIVGAIVLVATVGFFIWNFQSSQKPASNLNTSNTQPSQTQTKTSDINFSNSKKSAHYESNTPSHGAILAAPPINIVIDFNFDLAPPSEIKITRLNEGREIFMDYGVGQTSIDENKLALRRKFNSEAPDDLYTVLYKACWPDKSCHDGSFQFAIDSSKAQTFEDQTGKREVTIKLSQIQFNPENIKISKGTKVTWINEDNVEHYVNTDSHPAHTYYPSQNSKALKKGDEFSLTFETEGIYPYHCSAHASSMIGSLLVE